MKTTELQYLIELAEQDDDEVSHVGKEARAELAQLHAESEGRRIALLEKSGEAASEWKRAENAEAVVTQLRTRLAEAENIITRFADMCTAMEYQNSPYLAAAEWMKQK